MHATNTIKMTDLSRNKHFQTDLSAVLTPAHTVGHAVEHYLDRMDIPDNGLRWTAYSRGVRLDNKQPLEQVPTKDDQWMILPEVTAGAR